jgi:hypothetical protein
VWSPDGEFVLFGKAKKDGGDKNAELRSVNVETGAIVNLGKMITCRAARWTSDTALKLVEVEHVYLEDSATTIVKEIRIRLWFLNVADGSRRLERDYAFPPGTDLWPLPGAEYVLISNRRTPPKGATYTSATLLSLTKDTRLILPDRALFARGTFGDLDWNAQRNKMAYCTAPDPQNGKASLVVVHAEQGIVASVPVSASHEYAGFRLSPDCKFLCVYCCPKQNALLSFGLPRIEVWNTETDEIVPIRALGMSGMLGRMGTWSLGASNQFPQWSPDGRYLAYLTLWLNRTQPLVGVEVADWGGWLAEREGQ